MSKKKERLTRAIFPLALSALLLAACEPAGTSSLGDGEGSDSSGTSQEEKQGSPASLLRQSQGNGAMESEGDQKVLVIPFSFSDDVFKITASDILALDSGFESSPVGYTALSYYQQSSGGKLNLSGSVEAPVTLSTSFEDFLNNLYSTGSSPVIASTLDEAIDAWVEEGNSIADYDSDGDGKIDNLIVANPFPAYNGTWTYGDETMDQLVASFMYDQLVSTEKANAAEWMCGSVGASFGTQDPMNVRFIKAIADLLGVPEYSDQTGDLQGNLRAPLGYTDVTEEGISDHNPFTKYLLGWTEPTKVIASSLETEATYTLAPGESLLLSNEDTGVFGEYLLIDYFTPTGLNSGSSLTEPAVRVYKVDSRLVAGGDDGFYPYYGEPDFNSDLAYDFAYTNSGRNMNAVYGIAGNYALVQLLDSTGANRQMTNSMYITDDNLWHEGDVFGEESLVEGFYHDFRFDGNGSVRPELGLTFEVGALNSEGATITVRRAN